MTATPGTAETRIVVGVDGSVSSQEALRWAAHFAAIFAAKLEVVAAWEYPPSYGWSAIAPQWDPTQDMMKVLDDAVQAVFGDQPGPAMHLVVREGGAAKVLLEASQGRRHACRGQPRPWWVRRATARLGERERRRACGVSGLHRARRPAATTGALGLTATRRPLSRSCR
jgi:K+-sensing histidine kinase KdpD